MSFPKAKIERFNDVKSCAPPIGCYDPKLPSLAGTGGHALYRLPRFSKENIAQNVPMTPTSTSDTRRGHGYITSCRPGPSMSAPRRLPGASLSVRSSSTFSLPTAIERGYQQPETEPEFEVRTFRNMDDEFLQAHDAELQESKDQYQKACAENEKLSKQVDTLRQDLTDAEARIVESDRIVEEFKDKLRNQAEKLDIILASQDAWKHQATNAIQKNIELQKDYDDLCGKVQEKETTIITITTSLEKERSEILALLEKFKQSEESNQTKFEKLQEQLDIQLKLNNDLEAQLQQRTIICDEMSASIQCWKEEVELFKGENENMKSSLDANIARCKALESMLKESQDKTAFLTSSVSELKKCELALEEAQSSVHELSQTLHQKNMELAQALAIAENYKTQSEFQHKNVDDILRNVNNLQLQIKILDELNNQKDQDLIDTQHGLEAEKTKVMFLQTTLEQKEKELLQSETTLLTYRNSLQEKESLIEEKVKSLEDTKTEIQTLHADYLTRLKHLELTITKQNTELENTKEELATQVTNCQQLNSQLSMKFKELEDCEQVLSDTSCNVRKLELDLSDKVVEINELKETANEFKLECENAHNAVEELERVLANETIRVRNMEELIQQKDDKLGEALRTIANDQIELTAAQTTLEAIKTELAESTLALKSTAENLKQEVNIKETLTKQLKEAENKVQCQISEYEEQTKFVESLQLQLSVKDLEAQSQHKELAAELAKSQELSRQLNEKCEEVQLCQNKLNCLTYQIEELQLELTDKDMEMSVVKASADAWKMHTDTERMKNQELEQTVADKGSTITALEKCVAEKDKELSNALRELDDERAQVEILMAKVDVTETELADTEKSLEASKDMYNKEVHLRADLEAKLAATVAAKESEQTEYLKRAAESELKMTSQSIKIAELKNDLDEVQCTANQLKSNLNERTDQLEKTRKDLEKNLEELEKEKARLTNIQNIQAQLCQEAEIRNQELTSAIENGKLWESRYEDVAEEREKQISRLKQAEVALERILDLQLKEASQIVELKKSDSEIRVLKNTLDTTEQSINNSKQKLISSAAEISTHLAARDKWKTKYQQTAQELDEHIKVCKTERLRFIETIEHQKTQITGLAADNASLKNLIGPFEDQLNLYKANLDAEKGTAASYKEKVSHLLHEQAKLMGHQNPKQKIHHLQKLKEENDKLLNKVFSLEKELKVKNKQINDLQVKTGKIDHRRIDPSQAFQHHRSNNMDHENLENRPV